MGMKPCGEADHLRGRGHLEVERHEELALQALHVLIPYMATILPQMGRDPVGAGQNGQVGGSDRVRVGPAAGVPDSGDVIDIDAEA